MIIQEHESPEEKIACPNCKSEKWRCYDDRALLFVDKETGQEFQWPIGYLVCETCGKDWIGGWPANSELAEGEVL